MYLEPIYVPGYLMMAVFDKYRQRTTCTNTVFDEVTESRCCVDDSFGSRFVNCNLMSEVHKLAKFLYNFFTDIKQCQCLFLYKFLASEKRIRMVVGQHVLSWKCKPCLRRAINCP